MINKGQIVEIPAKSALYKAVALSILSKKESLEQQLHYKNYSLFDGFLVGEHAGTDHFKLGQRKGINVGGKKAPLYVIGIDESANRIFVGEGEDHAGLSTFVLAFSTKQIIWSEKSQLTAENLEHGISVETSAENFENKKAVFYLIDQQIYLEFEHPIAVAMAASEISILHNKNNIATLKTTL